MDASGLVKAVFARVRRGSLSSLAFLALIAPSSAMAQQDLRQPASLHAYWADHFERTIGNAPAGYAFAVRDADETISGAHGFQRLAPDGRGGVAMRPDSVVHLASISKTITALALLHLLDERRIDLDTPFWPHLQPAFRGLAPGAHVGEITFAQMLAHRSGLPSREIDPPVMTNLAGQLSQDTASAPGSAFVYSNLNYTIARALIETISGETYEDYVRRVVLAPAGTTHMSLRPPPNSFVHRVGDTESTAFDKDFTEDAGGYGWYGSAQDVAAIFAHFGAGGYLSPDMRARMLRDRLGLYAFQLANGTGYSSDGHWSLPGDARGSKTAVVLLPGNVVVALVMNTVWDGNLVGVLTEGYRQNVPALLAVEPARTPSPLVRVTIPWHARDVRCAQNGEGLGARSQRYVRPIALEGREVRCAGFHAGRRITHIARLERSSD